MLDRIYKISKLLAVVSTIPLMVCLAMFVWSLKQTADVVRTTTASLPQLIDTRIDHIEKELMTKVDDVQGKLSKDLRFVASVADNRIGTLTTVADNRMASIESTAAIQVIALRNDLSAQLTTTNESVKTVTDAYASVPNVMAARLDKYTDCDTNDLCWQGQITDTMFAVRTASRDVSKTMIGVNKALPKIQSDITTISGTFATDIPKITTNFASITDNINRLTKPRWYDRLLGYGLNGAILYRTLNPATNLAITGATILSSPK